MDFCSLSFFSHLYVLILHFGYRKMKCVLLLTVSCHYYPYVLNLCFEWFQNCCLWNHFHLQTLLPHSRKYHLSLKIYTSHWILTYSLWITGTRDSFSKILVFLVSYTSLNSVSQLLQSRVPQPEAQSLLIHIDYDRHLEKTNYAHLQLLRQ